MIIPVSAHLLVFAFAGATTWLSLPLWSRWCRRIGLVDEPGNRKIHTDTMALSGGLAIATGMLLPLVFISFAVYFGGLEMRWKGLLTYGFDQRAWQLVGIMTGAVIMVVTGLADDRWELSARWKFGGQLLAALLVAASGVRLTIFVPNLFVNYLLTILWILTLVNALNFLDNMNGLCAGLGVIASLYFALLSVSAGQYLVAGISFLIAGAIFGFLPHNFPHAKAFLGDSGSHLVGYLLAVLGILPHFYSKDAGQPLAVLSPLLILAVPLYDIAAVTLIRLRNGKPVYLGDNNHVSHRLTRRGLNKTKAVLCLWAIAGLLGAVPFLLR